MEFSWPLRCSLFLLILHQVICPTGGGRKIMSSPRAKKILIPFFRNICLAKRGGSRSSRTWGGVRWTRAARLTSALFADGEAVWFWRPEAGVKVRKTPTRRADDGVNKEVVSGESAE
jgi:hypothetical protein